MKEVIVYGSGCPACHKLKALVDDVVKQNKIAANIEYSSDFVEMAKLGILSVPAIVVDGKVKSSGAFPGRDVILKLLE
ncbi:MAG: thioredoxin family protein [Gammaproteobacteria bacterium]|nr:thioredoxin family protein [Gammaproteobacteria bacterium]